MNTPKPAPSPIGVAPATTPRAPLPWHVQRVPPLSNPCVYGPDGVVSIAYANEDAAYIVRACNSFHAMREALEVAERLVGIARRYFPKSIQNGDRFDLENANATISEAIAKARGEA